MKAPGSPPHAHLAYFLMCPSLAQPHRRLASPGAQMNGHCQLGITKSVHKHLQTQTQNLPVLSPRHYSTESQNLKLAVSLCSSSLGPVLGPTNFSTSSFFNIIIVLLWFSIFSLFKTSSNMVLYCGRASSLPSLQRLRVYDQAWRGGRKAPRSESWGTLLPQEPVRLRERPYPPESPLPQL